jgi:mono/diheme cytochrome c family protein
MSMPRGLAATFVLLFIASAALAGETPLAPELGKPMTPAEVAKWDLSVFPDGTGLPDGKGTADQGAVIYKEQCERCHGANGRGATAEELVAEPQPLTTPYASKAIGPYWPYATTIFDYVRRSMPPDAPGTLTADQVYAITAYLLAANEVIPKDAEMNANTLPKVKMPNRNGFDWIDVKK